MIIYMEATINLIGSKNPEEAKSLVAQGEVRKTKEGILYLCIKE
jgi:hypothetical protein